MMYRRKLESLFNVSSSYICWSSTTGADSEQVGVADCVLLGKIDKFCYLGAGLNVHKEDMIQQ